MTPHSETHGIYRFRQIPGTDKEFYLERHKKTIYDSQGSLCYTLYIFILINFQLVK